MSTSELGAAGATGGGMTAALWICMVLLAGAGVYGALQGASPLLTLAAGVGVGVLWMAATRRRGGGR